MKKMLKIVIIVAIVLAILFGILVGWDFFEGFFERNKLDNERINGSTTLSNYIRYHDVAHTKDMDSPFRFYAENIKCDLLKDRDILYYSDGIMVLDDYSVYETAFTSDKTYSNGQQCKQIQTDIKIKQMKIIFETPYFISEDNKYYILSNNELTELEIKNLLPYDFAKQTTLLKDETIKKVIAYQGDNVYIIKNDGQVYKQEYKFDDNGAVGLNNYTYSYKLINEELLLSNKDYGNVVDIAYSLYDNDIEKPDFKIKRIVSDKGLFYLKQTDDQKYINAEKTYEMVASEIYNKYNSDVKYINADYIFTTDSNIILTETLCNNIDKEVK